MLKRMLATFIVFMLVMPCWVIAQENAPIITPIDKEELSPEEFWQDFLTAAQNMDDERVQQLVTANPQTAARVYQQLVVSGQGADDKAEAYRLLADHLRTFLPENLPNPGNEAVLNQFLADLQDGIATNNIPWIAQLLNENPELVEQVRQTLLAKQDTGFITLLDMFRAGDFSFLFDTLLEEGHRAYLASDYQTALAHWQTGLEYARALNHQQYLCVFWGNIGMVLLSGFGQYEQALTAYQHAHALVPEMGEHSVQVEGKMLIDMSVIYFKLGQYTQALESAAHALTIAQANNDPQNEITSLNNLGAMYENLGQSEEAVKSYEQALDLAQDSQQHSMECGILNNLGEVSRKSGQYEQALTYYTQGLQAAKAIDDRRTESAIFNNLSLVYTALQQYSEAFEVGVQALTLKRASGDRQGECDVLLNIGLINWYVGDYPQANAVLKESLGKCVETGAPEAIWRAQRNLGKTEVSLKLSPDALMHYGQALDTIETIRAGLSEATTKTVFMQDKLYVYDEVIRLLFNLHTQSPEKGYDRQAFETFERKQGRAFLEEMGQSGARLFAGIPAEIVQKELDLQNQLETIQTQVVEQRARLMTEPNKELIQTLEQQEKTLLADQAALQAQIKNDYPDYYALRYPKPVALSDLQQQVLQLGELLLVYHVMENQTILWAISRQDFMMLPLNLTEEQVTEAVEAFRKTPNDLIAAAGQSAGQVLRQANATLADMTQHSYALYQQLVPAAAHSLLDQAQTVFIVPTRSLYGVPFEALVTDDPTLKESPHYFVQDHPITYLSSASLLKILRDAQARRKQTTTYPLLAFANPVYDVLTPTPSVAPGSVPAEPIISLQGLQHQAYLTLMGGNAFPPLPDTETQAQAIAETLNAPQDGEPLQLGEQAAKQTVLRFNQAQRLDDYRYVLFAAHGILPGEINQITQPALVLSHPEQDGYLTMADAFGLQMNAKLVLLSACNTGRGVEVKGEGIMGLTRAFMYAGTPAVGVTLWSVDSRASSDLTTRMFRHLKDGNTLAVALQQAKLDVLNEAADDETLAHFRHPFFWAPFVVFGDGR